MQINDSNYLVIQGWMRTELELKGNDLLVYAIIYGFSQTESQKFTGGLQYLADWCGATKQGVIKNIKHLIQKELITKEVKRNPDGTTYAEYTATGIKHSLMGIKHSLPYNEVMSNEVDKDEVHLQTTDLGIKRKKDKKIGKGEIETFRDLYNEHCTNLRKVRQLSDKRIQAIKSIIQKYSIDDITEAFDKANSSKFLTGDNDRGWTADIDFILREDKFVSILEGKYDSKKKKQSADGLVLTTKVTDKERRARSKYEF